MAGTGEIIIGILMLGAVIVLTRQFHAWKIKRAYLTIIEDLKSKDAHTPETAIHLPYAGRSPLRFGARDHRPMALKGLILENLIGITEDGRYYILDGRVRNRSRKTEKKVSGVRCQVSGNRKKKANYDH